MSGISHPRIRIAYGQLTAAEVNAGTVVIPATTPTVSEATITCVSVQTNEYVVIDGLTYTAKTTEALTSRQFDDDAGDNATATSLAACINQSTYGVPGITASASANVVTLTRQAAHPARPVVSPSASTMTFVNATGALNLTGVAKQQQIVVVDAWVRAIGGAAGSNTSVNIGTTASTPVITSIFTRAGLTEGAVLRAGTATTGVSANLNLANAPGVGIKVYNVGSPMDTATALDYCIYYTIGKGNTAT